MLISQHADNSTPATTAQSKGAFFTSYNNDMISVAPEACLTGTRIDWSIYFEEAIEAVATGKVNVKGVVTNVFDFDDIQNAMDRSVNDKADIVKSVVKIS